MQFYVMLTLSSTDVVDQARALRHSSPNYPIQENIFLNKDSYLLPVHVNEQMDHIFKKAYTSSSTWAIETLESFQSFFLLSVSMLG